MAGHSKWHNIQHRKGAQDKKRGKIFTKIIHEITVAAKSGDPDVNSNPRLRLAVEKANKANMPKDTIKRAIQRGAGGDDGIDMSEMLYEGYGPNGVAILVECLTDNKNRTAAEVRHAFSKCGGNLGASGSVEYLFNKHGILRFNQGDEDTLFEQAIEAGADDVIANEDGSFDVITSPQELHAVKQALVAQNFTPDQDEINYTATTSVSLDEEQAEKMLRLNNMLEDCDDVQNVYSNADISDEIMDKLFP
jgi:YebC/PmpR family DNA-binding regulatory protein